MQPTDTGVLMLAGDVMTGRGIDQVLMHPGDPALYETHVHDAREYVELAETVNGRIATPVPASYVWGDALAEMQRMAPRLRIVNLETAITTTGAAWPAKGIHYRMHPGNIDCLSAAHIDACALANNHVLDWGRPGMRETLSTLDKAHIHFAGAGATEQDAWAPAHLPWEGRGEVLLFSCAVGSSGVPGSWAAQSQHPGVALLPDLSASTTERLAADIAHWRHQQDIVVLSIHWGGNWGFEIPASHRQFAHRLIDLGAVDVVHGHSSHHPLPLEVYRDKLILYGCGDLINDYEGIGTHSILRSDVGCLYFVSLELATGKLARLDIAPFRLSRFRLWTADDKAHLWLRQVFQTSEPDMGPQPRPVDEHHWALCRAAGPQ